MIAYNAMKKLVHPIVKRSDAIPDWTSKKIVRRNAKKEIQKELQEIRHKDGCMGYWSC